MDCPKCGNPIPGLVYHGVRVPEGSPLYRAYTRLSKLHDGELAKVVALIDLFWAEDGMGESVARLHKRVDRLEQRLGEKGADTEGAHEDVPAKKKPSRRRGAKKPDAELSSAVAELLAAPVETVEERQARMARMEKDEKRKEQALARIRKKAAAKEPDKIFEEIIAGVEAAEAKPKRKPRRRRRRGKGAGGASIPPDAALPA